jgi:hypothetical protein
MNDVSIPLIRQAIAEDEAWIVKARALISADADCSSMEESIARAQRDILKMRRYLRSLLP